MLLIKRTPFAGPVATGVNVMGKLVDLPAARVVGESAGTENGELVVISETIAGEVPVLVIVNITVSDLLTATAGKTTAPPVSTGTLVPLET